MDLVSYPVRAEGLVDMVILSKLDFTLFQFYIQVTIFQYKYSYMVISILIEYK